MAPAEDQDALKAEELAALLREVRERVRARYPRSAGDVSLPDLMPIVHARDAALAKVAAIGTVNPRPGGPLNWLIQSIKKIIARALDWHVREQVEFNRNVMACLEATLEALNEVNRFLAGRDLPQLEDMRSHWEQWRVEWERKLAANEMQFLRSVADLQGAFQHRATLMETSFRDLVRSQHADFRSDLERSVLDIQKRLWEDMAKIRAEFERLIHAELRIIRQRAAAAAPAPPSPVAPVPPAQPAFDYTRFAERFRGSQEYVKEKQKFYLPYFAGRPEVLDIGCGRGEFLGLMRDASVAARGIDLSQECVDLCRQKGLQAEVADLFPYLAGLADASLDGIFCAQVVEHLPPDRLPEMIRLSAAKLVRGGILALETPNPECLAIFAVHFYLDPTHIRPIPYPLLVFYMEEYGFGQIEVQKLSPALESMPALAGLPEDFREAFFGGLDYAVIGRKLL